MKYYILLFSILFLIGCGEMEAEMHEETMTTEEEAMHTTTIHNILYYGDIVSNKVVAVDIDKMMLTQSIDSNGEYPYEVAQGFGTELFVINRKDYTLGVLDTISNTISSEIALDFYPRSVKINNDDVFLTSANEPAGAIINTNLVSPSYTDSAYVEPVSYGGSNATGHPVWVDDNYFLLLDRTENSIELYTKGNYQPIDKLTTKSSVHHVMLRDGYYYGVEEGEQTVVSPGIIKFSVANGKISLQKERLLSELKDLPRDFLSETWGSHHAAFHPSKEYIYVGSTEGNVFVMDLAQLSLVDTFKSGKGVGHITFYDNMLITTNHYDNFKSFYDVSDPINNKFLKNVYFSNHIYSDITMQSHTTHFVGNRMYFMFNTDNDATLYEVNLSTLSIERKVMLFNHYCLMGSLVESESTSDM